MNNKNFKKRFSKKNVVSGIILSATFCLTFLFFSPIDIFLANQIDFIVGYDKIMIPMFIASLLSSLLLTGILMLCLLINEFFFHIIKNLLFGLLCAMYVQMLFLNGKMNNLTGVGVIYVEQSKLYTMFNFFVYLIIISLPLIIWCIKDNYPNVKFLNKLNKKTVPFICVSISLMQLIGSVSMIFNYGLRYVSEDDYIGVISFDGAFTLSGDENIVVFLTDRLDSLWMDKELDQFPQVNEILEGFTFYQNNVSNYFNTFPAVPQLLTGVKYNGQCTNDYLTEAWNQHNFMDTLHENNYRINLLVDSLTTFNSFKEIRDVTATYKKIEKKDYKIRYIDERGIIPTLIHFSFIKAAPYYLKEINDVYDTNFANDFIEIKNNNNSNFPRAVGISSDLAFYDQLKDKGINLNSDKKTFNFIHLNFAHQVSNDLVALMPDNESKKEFLFSCIRGEFEIINEYFRQMKELGIYDKSTIIILGDHGRPPKSKRKDGSLTDAIVTTLLIKEANAERKPLKINSDAELSNDYFNASILEYAGIDHSEYGYSYNDIINNNIHIDRIMNMYRISSQRQILDSQYIITGDSRNYDNWKYIKKN